MANLNLFRLAINLDPNRGWIVAEMRDKATKAKDATVKKAVDTKDRHSSVPLKNTNWDPYSKNPPPPPPPRANKFTKPTPQPSFAPPPQRSGPSAGSPAPSPSPRPGPPPIVRPSAAASGPPPISRRRTRSRQAAPPPVRRFGARTTPEKEIDWVNLSAEDKEVLFGWLDEFFSRHLNRPIGVGA
ncbi:hypothetical protein B0H14DRAFT_2627091 [Mycena olivaceomarginata]|nr:hypothetical protein B0H14DRAFT_2627091 [Mycena olivaceomarginata]